MAKIIIATDSTADLSHALLKELDIVSIPLYVNLNEKTYRDGIDITTSELYKLIEETGSFPKTQAVSPADFIRFFEPFLKAGHEVIYIGIGSKNSATFQSALLAKTELDTDHLYLIDSGNISSGIALLVLKAQAFRKEGLSAQAIYEKTKALVPYVKSQFVIKTLDYLHRGGRASGTAKLIGSMLRMKPIIHSSDGKLSVYKKPLGKMSRALDMMLQDFFTYAEKDQLDLDYVMITHSEASKQAVYMIDQVKSKVTPKHLIESEAGCVISAHCGRGTIGILYIVKP